MPESWIQPASSACIGAVLSVLLASIFMGGADHAYATSICVLGLLLIGAFALFLAKSPPAEPLILGGLLAAMALSGAAGNWDVARTEWLQLCGAAAIWSTGRILGRDRYIIKLAWYASMATAMTVGVFAMIVYGLSFGDAPGVSRMKFTFGSANSFAALMAIGVILSAGHIAYKLAHHTSHDISIWSRIGQLPGKTILSLSALVVCASCVLLSLSRASLILTALALMVVAIASVLSARDLRRFWNRSVRQHPIASTSAVAVSLFGIALLLATETQLGSRAVDLQVDAQDRWLAYHEYWKAWQHHPVFGHGLGSFNQVNEQLTTIENAPQLVTLGAAHNVGLQWLLQTGLVGTLIMDLIWLAIHCRIVRALLKPVEGANLGFVIAVLAVSVYLSLHSMIDFPLELPGIMWVYSFLLGLACGIATSDTKSTEVSQAS